MNGTARVSPDGTSAELWLPTQAPGINQLSAAGVLKTKPDRITVHTMYLGGGFGRRNEQDFVVDAVLLAKITGKPVKVVWSREDDVRNDKFRPLTGQFLQAGLDEDGNLSAWRHRIVAAGLYSRFNPAAYRQLQGRDAPVAEGHEITYSCLNQLHELFREERGYDVGFWRGVGTGYTKFASESFIDEIARAQRIDPVQFRLRLLAHHPRGSFIVRRAAETGGWGRKPRGGRALGFAYSDAWRSYVATVAEVSVDRKSGKIRVHEVWTAVDTGVAIQPDIIVAQMEGGTVFAVSAALHERITIEDGVVQQSNFHNYPLLRLADVPETHIEVFSTDNPPGGIGEAGIPTIAPAIANAVAALTRARVRQLPMLPERVQAALERV